MKHDNAKERQNNDKPRTGERPEDRQEREEERRHQKPKGPIDDRELDQRQRGPGAE